MKSNQHVLVAVDGSSSDEIAVIWAAQEADMRHVPLLILHVMDPPALFRPLDAELADRIMSRYAAIGQRVVSDAAARASATAPVEVRMSVRSGQVVPTILEAADRARIVVLGSGRRFDPSRARLGSVATHITAHARCPVIVAREPAEGEATTGPAIGQIVIGIDGSELSMAAVAFGFEEAAWRGTGVTAVHAWENPRALWATDLALTEELETAAARIISESLAGWSEKYPDVPVKGVPVRAHPVQALLEASAGAGLLVVGSHGRGRFGEMVLGSVSQALLRHASTSVAVVRNMNGRIR